MNGAAKAWLSSASLHKFSQALSAPLQDVSSQGEYAVTKKWILILFTLMLISCSSNSEKTVDFGENPTYPAEAAANNVGGYVRMVFDITEQGVPTNIRVIESVPAGVFDETAISALSKWKYKPKIVDGTAVKQLDLKVQLDFELAD